jgi:hypothetical protein
VHFETAKPIPGNLFPISPGHPVVWPMGHSDSMVEARIQIQSSSEPGGGAGGHHRRRSGPSDWKHSFLHNNHKWNKLLRLSAPRVENLAKQGRKNASTVKTFSKPARPLAAPKEPVTTSTARKLLQSSPPPVPAPWEAYWDDEDLMYYYWNPQTEVSTWDAPAMPADSPPPPPPAHDGDDHNDGDNHDSPSPPPAHDDGHGAPAAHDDHGAPATDGHGTDVAHGEEHGEEHAAPIIDIFLFEFGDMEWEHCPEKSIECIRKSAIDEVLLGRYQIKDEEQAILMEYDLKDDSRDQYFIVISEHPEPMAIAIKMHSLGWTGRSQVFISSLIMVLLFGMIMTEVLHRTMAAMIGAALCMIMLAIQNRVPSLSTVVGWMDHGTLGLLWGMMLIVGITMRTGVFEWTGVLACKLAKGDKTQLLLLLCVVTAVLSAFLDNVTTILLIAPLTCKLCKLVGIDPRPYLICEAIFSNVGGTATMIGDPPNIIIGIHTDTHMHTHACTHTHTHSHVRLVTLIISRMVGAVNTHA